jgi:hypothetical protein
LPPLDGLAALVAAVAAVAVTACEEGFWAAVPAGA